MLRTRAAGAPVLLVLDDLHNAGLATLEQLHLLARTLRARGRCWSWRRCAPPRAPRRCAGSSRWPNGSTLGPLDDDAVHRARRRGRARRPGRRASRSAPAGTRCPSSRSLRAISAGETGVPASLTAAVLGRVGRLAAPEQELVRAACVLGASFEPATVAAAARDPDRRPRSAAPPCWSTRGWSWRPGASYEFANDLVQEVLYASTPEPTRYAYHRLAMDLLADRPETAAAHAAACGEQHRAAQAWLVRPRHAAAARFAASRRRADPGPRAGGGPADRTTSRWSGRCCCELAGQRETLGRYGDAVDDFTAALDIAPAHGCGGAGDARAPRAGRRRAGGAGSADGQLRPAPGGRRCGSPRGSATTRRPPRSWPGWRSCGATGMDFLTGREYGLAAVAGGPAQRRRHGAAARAGRPEDHVRVRRRPGRAAPRSRPSWTRSPAAPAT